MKNAAIYYVPEAFSMTGQRLMGRNAAGWAFLKAFYKYADIEQLAIFVESKKSEDAFLKMQPDFGDDKPILFIKPSDRELLSKIGNIFYPTPEINKEAWSRTHFGDTAWGITGITHTTSSDRVMDAIKSLLTSSLNPWDAIICTSEAVKRHILNIIEAEVTRLKHRLKIQQIIVPELPVIPLGVHMEDFTFKKSDKKSSKKILGIPEDSIVIIYMGRLSFHAKAHPVSMYRAIETAAQMSGKKVTIIECGWFANDFMEKAFTEASDYFLKKTTIIRLDGRKPSNRHLTWSSADIFCSFADNIQETFGLTPIEAMASGLPCVVSDWNGYKETVRDQVDGFRIPTLMPEPNAGAVLAARYDLGVDNYDFYCGHTNELISVDTEAGAKAFQILFEDIGLRKRMGESGRLRAESEFSWSKIITRYQELWEHQNEIRLSAFNQNWKTFSNPSRQDPFLGFNHYSSATIKSKSKITLIHKNVPHALVKLAELEELKVFNFGKITWINDEQILLILEAAEKGKSINEIDSEENQIAKTTLMQGVAWLFKLGLIKFKN